MHVDRSSFLAYVWSRYNDEFVAKLQELGVYNGYMLNVILLSTGIGLGLTGVFISAQPLFATAVVLIVTPLIQKLVDDTLAEKWSEVITIFLGITGFISVSIWIISSITEATNITDRFHWCLIVVGAGVIQLAWKFLVAETGVFAQVECSD